MFIFENLTVYQKSLTFTDQIYKLTATWPKEYLFNLTDQIRTASLSICLNIAEGSSRSKKEFKHFLDISRGSCYECIPLIDLAEKRDLLSQDLKKDLYSSLSYLAKILTSLKSSIHP